MEKIDWSKAPEKATHYDTIYDLFCDKFGYWEDGGEYSTCSHMNWGSGGIYIERPKQNGQKDNLKSLIKILVLNKNNMYNDNYQFCVEQMSFNDALELVSILDEQKEDENELYNLRLYKEPVGFSGSIYMENCMSKGQKETLVFGIENVIIGNKYE